MMKTGMRAELQITSIKKGEENGVAFESITFHAVSHAEVHRIDEDNRCAMDPLSRLDLVLVGPDLIGKHKKGQIFYVDFTEVE